VALQQCAHRIDAAPLRAAAYSQALPRGSGHLHTIRIWRGTCCAGGRKERHSARAATLPARARG
jgi:hypothetical protein